MVNNKKRVVIVGGGFAGVKAALELSNDKHFEVTLITSHSRFEYHGAMYRSATGRSPLEVVVALNEIFENSYNVRIELDSIAELRPETKEVEGETGRTYQYDILVMSVGYVVNYFDIEGMTQYSESMYSISDAIKLRHRLVGAFRNSLPGEPVTINVIGAGPTGVEIIADVKNFAKMVEGRHGLPDLDIITRIIEAGPRVLPGLSEQSSKIAKQRLEHIGVDVRLNTMVTKCSKESITTDKGKLESDITVWTAGNKANPLFASYPDIFTVNKAGRVKVNDYFGTNLAHIYVIGDAADTPYSGMAQTAIHNAIALTRNLKFASRGKHMSPYQPKRPAYVVPIGGEWALLETHEGIKTGDEGWKARRDADRWVLENFLVYELANDHYEHGNKIANF